MHIATVAPQPSTSAPPRDLIVGEPGSPVASAADPRFAQYKVIRRNGSVVGFEGQKISIAMTKANFDTEVRKALVAAGLEPAGVQPPEAARIVSAERALPV